MRFFSRVVFPPLCDFVLDRPFLGEYRTNQLARVRGDVLEIGVGTGLNLPHYPQHVRQIVTVEPNPGMSRRLARRARHSGIKLDARLGRGERLPFEAASFDCVVSTLTLCSITEVDQAIREIHRVLKTGGQFTFFEHGLSREPTIARRQRRWSWLQQRLAGGCRLDLDVPRAIASAPFSSVEVDNFYLKKTPRTHGYIYRGVAFK